MPQYSWSGLKAAYLGESAFRQEVWLCVVATPLAFWLGRGWVQISLLLGSLVAVLVVELLNSAVEAVVDRVSFELHDLSKRAKDIASAAVLLSLLFAAGVWVPPPGSTSPDVDGQTAASSVSPVRMRTTCSTGMTKILPSPILPVLAARQDGVDAALDVLALHHHLHLHLGQKVDHVLSATVELGVALLAAKALDLGDREARHAHLGQGLAHFIELEGFDDGNDLLHGFVSG